MWWIFIFAMECKYYNRYHFFFKIIHDNIPFSTFSIGKAGYWFWNMWFEIADDDDDDGLYFFCILFIIIFNQNRWTKLEISSSLFLNFVCVFVCVNVFVFSCMYICERHFFLSGFKSTWLIYLLDIYTLYVNWNRYIYITDERFFFFLIWERECEWVNGMYEFKKNWSINFSFLIYYGSLIRQASYTLSVCSLGSNDNRLPLAMFIILGTPVLSVCVARRSNNLTSRLNKSLLASWSDLHLDKAPVKLLVLLLTTAAARLIVSSDIWRCVGVGDRLSDAHDPQELVSLSSRVGRRLILGDRGADVDRRPRI